MHTSQTDYPHRKRNRLEGYDYSSAGAYFVTICAHDLSCLFGEIVFGEMHLNGLGTIISDEWLRTGNIRPNVILDDFVIMPNHLHGVIVIDYPRLGCRQTGEDRQGLERIVAGFKAACVRRSRASQGIPTSPVWQKSFHDEIIRDQQHLDNVRKYIAENVSQWANDTENSDLLRRE